MTTEITDITSYLQQHEEKDLLRFLTCGSVDDGKSTLIGRLLYDCCTEQPAETLIPRCLQMV